MLKKKKKKMMKKKEGLKKDQDEGSECTVLSPEGRDDCREEGGGGMSESTST